MRVGEHTEATAWFGETIRHLDFDNQAEAVDCAHNLQGQQHPRWRGLVCVVVGISKRGDNWRVSARYELDRGVDFSDLRRMAEEACRQ